MAIIPAEEKVFMVSNSTNTTYSGSASLKAMQQWYTMDDVSSTVRPYKVFTALMAQTEPPLEQTITEEEGTIRVGQSYEIDSPSGSGWDFTNIGAPDNEIGTGFIATGTVPNSWGDGGSLLTNRAIPVVVVLENTIGNVWFEYRGIGTYRINSNSLFTTDKTTCATAAFYDQNEGAFISLFPDIDADSTRVKFFTAKNTGEAAPELADAVVLQPTLFEIRVYN
jgi:hypothetical protein